MIKRVLSILLSFSAAAASAQSSDPSAIRALNKARRAAVSAQEAAAGGGLSQSAYFNSIAFDEAAAKAPGAKGIVSGAASAVGSALKVPVKLLRIRVKKHAEPPVPGKQAISAANGSNLPAAGSIGSTPSAAPEHHVSDGYIGPYSEGDFELTTGRCSNCNAPVEGRWYFEDEVIAVPKIGKPALVWVGSKELLEGVRLSDDGKSILTREGEMIPFSLVPKIPSNRSYYNEQSLAFFKQRTLRMRGEFVEDNGQRRFVARSVWPEDFRIDPEHLNPIDASSEDDFLNLVRKDNGGAQTPFNAGLIWEKPGSGRNWGGKPIFGVMVNGAQGDDDESLAGHMSTLTGRMGPHGEMGDWIDNNFYSLDVYSEKGIQPAMSVFDKYMADLNAGQSWYRPTHMVIAVMKDDQAAMKIQEHMKQVYSDYYLHKLIYSRETNSCSSLVQDPLREDGWNIPKRGPSDLGISLSAAVLIGLTKAMSKDGAIKSGISIWEFMRQEPTRIFPRAAFEAMGSDMVHLGNGSTDRPLTPFERTFQDDIEGLIFVHIPQIPSSRRFGRDPVSSVGEYFKRAPKISKWETNDMPDRPYPPPH